jgi:hypothetical protein
MVPVGVPYVQRVSLWGGGISRRYQYLEQRCPTFLYIGAHLTDGCGGAGDVWRLQ